MDRPRQHAGESHPDGPLGPLTHSHARRRMGDARLARTETEPNEWVTPGRDYAFLVEQQWKAFKGDTAEIMKTH